MSGSILSENYWTLIIVGLFCLIAFGGWCFQCGANRQRQATKDARDERIKMLEDAGYDARPRHTKVANPKPPQS
jgi:hypothetical protein